MSKNASELPHLIARCRSCRGTYIANDTSPAKSFRATLAGHALGQTGGVCLHVKHVGAHSHQTLQLGRTSRKRRCLITCFPNNSHFVTIDPGSDPHQCNRPTTWLAYQKVRMCPEVVPKTKLHAQNANHDRVKRAKTPTSCNR
mmetsp:Transcript_103902/g.206524  ORF Transcript_103902/g.206524 Transcript_103902/m.206524 type:complete len:143 (+) Transcript_103902:213-641(+)